MNTHSGCGASTAADQDSTTAASKSANHPIAIAPRATTLNPPRLVALVAHPLANAYRGMTPEEYAVLKADIAKHGVRVPGWLYEGKILDGRHRWRAGIETGEHCPMQEYTGDDPRGFAASLNEARRHLNEGARALKAAAEATAVVGRPETIAPIDAISEKPVTKEQAAVANDVSPKSVERAKKVLKQAVPEVVEAVRAGEVPVSVAAAVADLPADRQREVAAAGPAALKAIAKAARPAKPDELDALRAEVADLREKNDMLAMEAESLQAENTAMAKLLEADDRVNAAMAEAKKHRELAAQLQVRLNGMMNEKSELIRTNKALRRKLEGK